VRGPCGARGAGRGARLCTKACVMRSLMARARVPHSSHVHLAPQHRATTSSKRRRPNSITPQRTCSSLAHAEALAPASDGLQSSSSSRRGAVTLDTACGRPMAPPLPPLPLPPRAPTSASAPPPPALIAARCALLARLMETASGVMSSVTVLLSRGMTAASTREGSSRMVKGTRSWRARTPAWCVCVCVAL
jgi:hypothetical protein